MDVRLQNRLKGEIADTLLNFPDSRTFKTQMLLFFNNVACDKKRYLTKLPQTDDSAFTHTV